MVNSKGNYVGGDDEKDNTVESGGGTSGTDRMAAALLRWALLRPDDDWKGLALNLVTELAGAAVTYVLFELVIGRIEKREAKKADLIAQMGSSVREEAIRAVEELAREGWLTDGSLQGVNLSGANLQGANLHDADLQEIDLSNANLKGANLSSANLKGANLSSANLKGAGLAWARLQKADLWYADLQAAGLSHANLYGVSLLDANLKGAELGGAYYLREASFNVTTTLPDGTRWTPDTDITRFTDVDMMPDLGAMMHSDFKLVQVSHMRYPPSLQGGFVSGPPLNQPESPRAPSPLCEGAFFFPEMGVKVRYLVGKVLEIAP